MLCDNTTKDTKGFYFEERFKTLALNIKTLLTAAPSFVVCVESVTRAVPQTRPERTPQRIRDLFTPPKPKIIN